jgi:uracil-DNA glycosylase family 4
MPRIFVQPRLSLPVRGARLEALFQVAEGCRACPGMPAPGEPNGVRRVLSSLNGSAHARLMFVAEAPGRNGADRTGVPIHGDPSGVNFETLIASIGLSRKDVFVTNCVLCNPRDPVGNNRTPYDSEIMNCSTHLDSQIRVVDPAVVVTLGAKPLQACSFLEPHTLVLRESVAKATRWAGRYLFPVYHPSPRALIARPMSKQREDYRALKKLLTEVTG